MGDNGTPAAVGWREHLFAAIHQLGVKISQLFLAVTIEHQTGTIPTLQPSLIALEVATHKVNTACLEVQVYNVLTLKLHLGITTEHTLVKRDRLLAIIREVDVRYNVCHSLSFRSFTKNTPHLFLYSFAGSKVGMSPLPRPKSELILRSQCRRHRLDPAEVFQW